MSTVRTGKIQQFKMSQLDDKFKVKIKQLRRDGTNVIIEAPLPDQFGFTVGSEFTAPFDSSSLGSVLQKFKIPMAGQAAKKVGVTTTKFYSNPEPTEISFELEFHAEYSARKEVVEPVVALMAMSLGDSMDMEAVSEFIGDLRGDITKFVNSTFELEGDDQFDEDSPKVFEDMSEQNKGRVEGAMALLGLIRGPETTTIRFGNVYILDSVWISSVSPQFSNVIDADGYPLSATVSVSAVIQRDPVVSDLNRYFGASSRDDSEMSAEEIYARNDEIMNRNEF